MTRLEKAQEAYFNAFGKPPPEPYGVSDDTVAIVLEQALLNKKPIAPDFDFWAYLPPDSVA